MILVFWGYTTNINRFFSKMRKEINNQNGTNDNFWKEFSSEKLEIGSDSYRAVKEALEIGRIYHLKFELRSGLSGIEGIEMELHKDRIVETNVNYPAFVDKFIEICNWMVTDLGTIPAARISRKLGYLEDKLEEVNGRTDLV